MFVLSRSCSSLQTAAGYFPAALTGEWSRMPCTTAACRSRPFTLPHPAQLLVVLLLVALLAARAGAQEAAAPTAAAAGCVRQSAVTAAGSLWASPRLGQVLLGRMGLGAALRWCCSTPGWRRSCRLSQKPSALKGKWLPALRSCASRGFAFDPADAGL